VLWWSGGGAASGVGGSATKRKEGKLIGL